MQPSRRFLLRSLARERASTTALVLLAGCTGFVEPENGGEGQPADVTMSAARDAGRDARGSMSEAGDSQSDDEAGDEGLTNDLPSNRPRVEGDGGLPADAAPSGKCVETEDFPLAQGLHIRQLALYQTVKVPLYEDGAWVAQRSAPVVQNKKALVRVFVDPLAGYQPHDVRAVLKLVNGADVQELVDERALSAASSDAQLASTFSFQVEPAALGAATELSVSLVETNCGAASGAAADARFPSAGGTRTLDATSINKLKVVVLPVNVNGRLPVTTDKELANMRAALLAYYPVPDVDISVRAPLTWTQTVDALDGNSWSDLLNQVMRERRTDAPSSNTYYFGLVQPGSTFRGYCQRGCVLGLAPQTTSVMPTAQVALGASFADAQTYETMVHELGHAHGRGHAPCVEAGEIDGVDRSYPDPTGATGTWGWDSRSNTLMPPTDKDIMGYCEPNWISAYNYAGIATRSVAVNLKAFKLGSPVPWQNVLLYDDGRARWGGALESAEPAGEVLQADVLDATGVVIDQVEVVRIALSHAGATFLYVPQPGAQWSQLRFDGRTLQLAEILPPL